METPRFFMSFPVKHIALVCNPTKENEKALRVTDSIAILLKGMDIRHSIFTTCWPAEWNDISEVWIIGGDGTLNYFINEYPDIQLPLSIFAGGTGNDFHWMLYGEIEIEQQVDKILEGSILKLDAGICNKRLFLNGIGIGFDGAIVKDLLGKKKRPGKSSYLLSILKNILGYREKQCFIQMPGETISQECFMISIANAQRFGGGFKVTPKACFTDELLDVNVVGKISAFKRIRYLPVIEKGEHINLPFITYRQVPKITISCSEALNAHRDGEYFTEKEFEIEILPKRFSFLN